MGRIAYLMSHYPAISHTFVLREVEALRDLGVDVQTLSIHRVGPGQVLGEGERAAAATTFSVLPTSAVALLRAHAEALLRSPQRYLSTLVLALRTGAPGVRDRLWHLFYFAEAMILLRHCRRAGITHVHAIFADSATDVAMLIAHYERGKSPGDEDLTWSLAVHGSVEFYNVARYAIAQKLERAKFAVAISDFGRSQLMTLSSQERWSHIHVVRCGVDPCVYTPSANRTGSATSAEFLFVGRLLRGKGVSLLFESLAALRKEGLDVTATVVGDGPAGPELETRATVLGVRNAVSFVGSIGPEEIRGLYERADIFCLPSFAEGIPVVAMEAMAMELPVVTTRIMGVPELVEDGQEGLLVPPGRADALTDALRRLVCAPDQRRQMGLAGRQKVMREFDVHACARKMYFALQTEIGIDQSAPPFAPEPDDGHDLEAGAVSRGLRT
jgi:glycosyltransferase involved in cell wall biosynthesis